jgi:tetratricopeptide (TPR) repeat protein
MRLIGRYIIVLIIVLNGCLPQRRTKSYAYIENIGPYLYYYEAIQNRLYGNTLTAISNLNRSITLDSTNSAAFYELALCYSSLNRYDEAIHSLKKAIDIDQDNIYYRNFLGIILINSERIEEAIENQKILINRNPLNISYAINYALLLSENAQFDKAIETLESIKINYGFVPKVTETLTRIYFELQDFEKARKELDDLLMFIPDNPLYLLYESDLNFKIGNDSLGFSKIYEAINLGPHLTYPIIELYNRQLENGMFKEGIETLKQIFNESEATEFEKIQLFYPILFEQYFYTSLPAKIDSLIFTLNAQYENSINISELSFEHFVRRRNFNEAKDALKKLIILDNENVERWDKLISLEYALENYEAVKKLSERAIEKFPQNHSLYILNAIAYDQMGDKNMAINTLIQGTKKVQNDYGLSDIYGTLGDFQYMIGNIKEAFNYYDKSLKLNSNNARILNNFSYYLSLRKEKLKLALEMSSKAVDLEPNNSTFLDTKGWVLFQMGNFEEAKDVLRNAIAKSGSSSAVINEHYGDALFKTGNTDNAYIYWIKAKEIGGGSDKLDEKIRTKRWIP